MFSKSLSSYLIIFALFWAVIIVGAAITYMHILNKRVTLQDIDRIKQPDCAMSTEAHFIRYRSLANVAEVFAFEPTLLGYFVSDFCYAPAPYMRARGEIE